METLKIIGEKNNFFIPSVHFCRDSGVCDLGGESYLEDTFLFYEPLVAWLKEYTEHKIGPITFNISLTYLNTASSKSLLDMLHVLKNYENSGGKVTVNWFVHEWDEDMKLEAEDMAADTHLEIVMKPLIR